MLDFDYENWISICYIDEQNEIRFTPEYLAATKEISSEARVLAARIIGGWDNECKGLLNYFGPEDTDEDWYTGIDGEPMDVGELMPETWEVRGIPINGLDAEWHRDLLRAKLTTLRLPLKLLETYIKVVKTENK